MIKENQRLLNRIQVMLDGLVMLFCYAVAWFIRFKTGIFPQDLWVLSLRGYMKLLVYILPGFLLLYYMYKLYEPKRVLGRRLEAWRILQANGIGVMVLIVVLYVTKQIDVSRRMLAVFAVLNVCITIIERNLIRLFLRNIRRKGYNLKQILLVGYSNATEGYIDRIMQNPEWGYEIRGILDDHKEIGYQYRGIKVIGWLADLDIILPESHLDEIVITLGLNEYTKLGMLVNKCEKSGVHTKFIPDYNNIIPTKPYTEDILGLPVINIRHVPLTNWLNRFVKRAVDIFGALVAIILFSPTMIVVSLIIKMTDSGPLIYKQERVGLKNEPFYMYKFRSMVVQKEADEKSRWTVKDDPRVTPIGRFMRKTSIDELPQLFNILKGDMSLVGPRPERPQFVEKFKEEIPRYMIKHQVRPGLTGWAQVNGYRGDTSIRKRIEYDLYYIENWTLGFDFKIILLTFFNGFINKNAY